MGVDFGPAATVVLGGFSLAFVFGAVAGRSNFCIMGAVSDAVNIQHWGRMRLWLLAIAIAMLGSNLLYLAGWIDLGKSLYHRPVMPWLSLLLGGTLFGVGMTIAGGCPNKNLVRLGAGSLRSLVVLVFLAIASYMTLKGLFAQWRVSYLDQVTVDFSAWGLPQQSVPALLSQFTGLAAPTALLVSTLCLALVLLVFVFKDGEFRSEPVQVGSGIVLGLLIAAGWYVTGYLGYGENPETLETVFFATNSRTLESLSFVAPSAYSLEMLMLWTDKSLRMTFGIASVIGVVLGSFVAAKASRTFRWEGFASLQDLRQNLAGAVLMGFGGVTAIGCTIGQGLSGVSTLAIGSFIAVFGIVTGSALTMKWLQR
ncbi:MAG: YeeE/YedE family protein [Rhodoferax sp.]|nr:YeeE/YedE family protein [Rhodoferax sp.]